MKSSSTIMKSFEGGNKDCLKFECCFPLLRLKWCQLMLVCSSFFYIFLLSTYNFFSKHLIWHVHFRTNTPKVSYSGGDDSVRMRTANNEAWIVKWYSSIFGFFFINFLYFNLFKADSNTLIWYKVFKNGPNKTCGRQSLNLLPLQIFKGSLPQSLLGPFLNTLSHGSIFVTPFCNMSKNDTKAL